MSLTLKPGDLIQTPSGRVGVVLAPPWAMPHHQLIEFNGDRRWVLSEILTPAMIEASQPRQRGQRRKAA